MCTTKELFFQQKNMTFFDLTCHHSFLLSFKLLQQWNSFTIIQPRKKTLLPSCLQERIFIHWISCLTLIVVVFIVVVVESERAFNQCNEHALNLMKWSIWKMWVEEKALIAHEALGKNPAKQLQILLLLLVVVEKSRFRYNSEG